MKKRDKYYFIDLFAGCGGMSLGLEQAGFTPILYNEINDSARTTYIQNTKDRVDPIITKDVKDITPETIEGLKNK